MIVKDEAAVLARCLNSVRGIADEIIIVDTGSTDTTVAIAKQYTDKIFPFRWVNDFSAARNASFSHATMEYILWLDADDVIDETNRQRFLTLKQAFPPEVDVGMFPYHVGFDEEGNCSFHYYRERLVRRSAGYRWQEPVHEHIAIHGNIREFDVAITHGHKERAAGSTRNLDIYRGVERAGGTLSTRALYYYARELRTHGLLEEAVKRYRRFMERGDGWAEDNITACSDLADCLVRLGRRKEALQALCKSFAYALPRAEICCDIGAIYLAQAMPQEAIFWYELALQVPRPQSWGFLWEDAWGYLPHMQLCLLYDRAGNREQALCHHQAAKRLKPQDPSVLYNEAYFYPEQPQPDTQSG